MTTVILMRERKELKYSILPKKINSPFLLSPTELFHWNFAKSSSDRKRTYDSVSGRSGTFRNGNWYRLNGVASIIAWDTLDFGDYNSECLSDPNLCHQGLSISFWLRHRRKYLCIRQ